MPRLRIEFANGSDSIVEFNSTLYARLYARDNVCYSNGKVQRVLLCDGNSEQPIWDRSWDSYSKHISLNAALARGCGQ